ncbi:MAG TPA: ribonuclease HII [bacterium]|nr:ribonuclease HII [bacterium]
MRDDIDTRYRAAGLAVIGVDEAGRGPLCGPVVVAAVHLLAPVAGLDDSKKLSEKQRESLVPEILRNSIWQVYSVLPEVIDNKNILHATLWGMGRAAAKVHEKLAGDKIVLIDGNRLIKRFPREEAIVKGDGKSASIAAASILAKVHRDRIMTRWALIYPQYGLAEHKGYPTDSHYAALARFGPTPIHRRSFRLVKQPEQGELF